MKALVFLLVLANLLFFAFSEGYFGRAENPDAGRVERQVLPERMRIVSRGEVPAAPVKMVAPEAEPVVPEAVTEAAKAEPVKTEPAQEEPSRPANQFSGPENPFALHTAIPIYETVIRIGEGQWPGVGAVVQPCDHFTLEIARHIADPIPLRQNLL